MNKAIPKTQWLGMAKVPFAVPQWVLWGLYSTALLRDPTVISAISWFTLSSLQKPIKSWEVDIGLLPMSHTEEAEARPWTIPVLPMFLIAWSRSMRGGLQDGVLSVPRRRHE